MFMRPSLLWRSPTAVLTHITPKLPFRSDWARRSFSLPAAGPLTPHPLCYPISLYWCIASIQTPRGPFAPLRIQSNAPEAGTDFFTDCRDRRLGIRRSNHPGCVLVTQTHLGPRITRNLNLSAADPGHAA